MALQVLGTFVCLSSFLNPLPVIHIFLTIMACLWEITQQPPSHSFPPFPLKSSVTKGRKAQARKGRERLGWLLAWGGTRMVKGKQLCVGKEGQGKEKL